MIGARRASSHLIVKTGRKHQALMMMFCTNWTRRLQYSCRWLWQPLTHRILNDANEMEEGGQPSVNSNVGVHDRLASMAM